MATIDELTPEQIRYPEMFQKIKELGDSFVRCVQVKEAYFLQEKLETLLKASNLQNFNPELQKEYDNLLVTLKWTALPLLPEEKVLNVLSNHYLAVLDNENIDVQDGIEAKMFTKDLFPRNELRQKMQKALRENKERLGNKTFGEWLLDYDKTFDFRERDELTHLQYVRQNPTVRALSEPEKNKLRKALQVFDKTLLVTPVMSEPLLSMAIKAMIKGGIIKEQINPALLKSFPLPAIPITRKVVEEIPKTPPPPPLKEIKKEIKPTTLDFEEKPKKPGLFKRLFRKKPEGPEGTKMQKEILTEFPKTYEKEISPYEKKRPLTIPRLIIPLRKPPGLEEIKTFPEEVKPEPKEEETQKIKPSAPITIPPYKIRTMKTDLEKAKKEPASQRGEPIPEKPKIYDNTVDLSGK